MKKVKRYTEGGDLDAGMYEKEPDENFSTGLGTVKPKPKIVTKEELEKSGLSLRDYMNKQQGLTRRGSEKAEPEAEPETKSTSSEKSVVFKKDIPKAITSSSFDPNSINFGSEKVEPKKESAERKYTQTRGGRLYDDERIKKSIPSGTRLFGDFSGSQRNPKKMSAGGTASFRADGIAQRGKTRGKVC